MPDPVLTDLAHQARAVSESAGHLARRRLWADLHALRPPRALVSYAMYAHVWEREIAPPELFHHASGLARHIETHLRARLWKAQQILDDEPLLPTVWLWTPRPPGDDRLWGVSLPMRRTEPLGAYKPIPPIVSESDMKRLHFPPYEEDAASKKRLEEQARELVGGLLPVKFHTDEIHYGPFEWAVRLRGMDNLLYDVYDRPDFVHRLMAFITDGMIAYHLSREEAGAVDAEASWGFHTCYDDLPGASVRGGEGARGRPSHLTTQRPNDPITQRPTPNAQRLQDCWAYVHAQSAASFSPKMYAEFIQPYNARLAALFGKVYYHGCEDLSAKAAIICDLPNLRLFHVGPWTPVEPVVSVLGNRFALEVHSHPSNVLFAFTPDEIRADLRARHDAARGVPHVLKLCDVETVAGRADRLRLWTELARETIQES
jgi:hypothetical protein